MSEPRQNDRGVRGLITRLVESHNPGVTLLVLVWTGAVGFRGWLEQRGPVDQIADDALRSLVYVIPIMLVAWGVLAFVDRRFRLGLFRPSDDA